MSLKEFSRWIGLLPCALIGSIAATTLILIFILIGDIFNGNFWIYLEHPQIIYIEHFFTPFIATAVFCGTFVYLGSYIAPNFKRQIAFVLSIVIIVPLSVLVFLAAIVHEWKFLAQCILGIVVAASTAYYWLSNDYNN